MKAELIDHMGSDLSIVNSARVSFDKASDWDYRKVGTDEDGYETWKAFLKDKDASLIRFLARGMSSDDFEKILTEAMVAENRLALLDCIDRMNADPHWTPFAQTAIKMRMAAPVPIRTQCFKHKQGFVENEESRRYIKSRPVLFIPDTIRSKPEGSIKQGSGDTHPSSGLWLEHYTTKCNAMIDLYMEMLADDVCPEQARFVLPQGVEVNWEWTGNLYSFANFFNKRTNSHAQKETQVLAKQAGKLIAPLFPVAWAALTGGKGGVA